MRFGRISPAKLKQTGRMAAKQQSGRAACVQDEDSRIPGRIGQPDSAQSVPGLKFDAFPSVGSGSVRIEESNLLADIIDLDEISLEDRQSDDAIDAV